MYNSCVLPAMTYGAETRTLTKQAQNKLPAAQTKMERSMLNITHKDRKTNIRVRERTTVIDMLRAYHPPQRRSMDLAVITWKPYDKKGRQGRQAKCWRNDLGKYWSNTIWQRTAQYILTWRGHCEALAQPRDTTAA